MNDMKFWEEVLKEAKKHLSEQEVETWIKPLRIVELRGDLITLSAPNRFYKSWVEDKYLTVLRSVFRDNLNIDADIEMVINGTVKTTEQPVFTPQAAEAPAQQVCVNTTFNLNKQYTFENFVTGNSNQFAHAACLAVGEGFFHTYNPLFIYGGVGLGKTHLMQAVGNRLVEKYPKMRVLYISSENFTNEMINAIKTKKNEEFREKYRNIDVLLFDDVQFLAGKTRSMEEFFHTFNSLYDSQKQIILTSDKTPNEIPDMEERLTSRFAWGLIADIQPPSVEERTAILMKRADIQNIKLPDNVALFLAENIKGENVRELIGALIRLSAYSSFHNEPLSISLAERTLEKFLIRRDRVLSDDDIITTVTGFFNVKLSDLKSKKRTKSISYPRQICMYLLREKMNISLAEIGSLFGGRDHSTVLHAIQSIEKKIATDPEVRDFVNNIQNKLYT